MGTIWQHNIIKQQNIIRQNQGPKVVNVVSGSLADQEYWQDRLQKTRQDVFREDGDTLVISSLETSRKGNFLGSVNAWLEIQRALQGKAPPPVLLMNMVFGQGKRLSPFTQALTNRKPAFPTPMCASNGEGYLCTVDAASMSATLWLHHLETNGFRGLVIKWGDEAVIPGKIWEEVATSYENVDGIRFVWQTEPTEDLAREKEWVEFDARSSQMTYQFTRQGMEELRNRLAGRAQDRLIGVNLGSLGISYRLMEVAEEVFRGDVLEEGKWVDWDPYTWIAFACQTEAEWRAEAAFERQIGKAGIRELEYRLPDFYQKIQAVCNLFQRRYGRQPMIKVLDFGQPFWMDWGLHLSLRRSLEAMTTDSEQGVTLRELFQLPNERDNKGNIIVRSSIAAGVDICDSLLVDTIITSRDTVMRGGVVVAGRHQRLEMPYGGSALFCAANWMKFNGPHAIAFKAIGDELTLEEGDRMACLFYTQGCLEMRSNESLINYEGENYSKPVMGNSISFEEATRRMSEEDTRLVERRWADLWSGWAIESH
jgi:hypothetical protein